MFYILLKLVKYVYFLSVFQGYKSDVFAATAQKNIFAVAEVFCNSILGRLLCPQWNYDAYGHMDVVYDWSAVQVL